MHSMSNKIGIEMFQDYLNISNFGRKHQGSFFLGLVLRKLYKVCMTQVHDENCIPGS